MAKGLRSKVKQRYKRAKRQHIDETVHSERINLLHNRVLHLQQGLSITPNTPLNAFLHPNHPEAEFPKKDISTVLDFRSPALPLSGYAVPGTRRHFNNDEKLKYHLIVGSVDGRKLGHQGERNDCEDFVNGGMREGDYIYNPSDRGGGDMAGIIDGNESKNNNYNNISGDDNINDDSYFNNIEDRQKYVFGKERELIEATKGLNLQSDNNCINSNNFASLPKTGAKEAVMSFSMDPSSLIDNIPTLEDLMKLQKRVGGKEKKEIMKPKLKNLLKKSIKKGKKN